MGITHWGQHRTRAIESGVSAHTYGVLTKSLFHIHVTDYATAHVSAIKLLAEGHEGGIYIQSRNRSRLFGEGNPCGC